MIKGFVTVFSFLFTLLAPSSALANATAAKITDVSVKRTPTGVSVDLTFDKAVSSKSLKPAFERNFAQFVLKGTKVDASKMLNVADSGVAKVFAYPYSPDTARVRIIFKKSSDWAKGRISLWNNNPKTIRLFVKDPKAGETEISAVAKPKAEAPKASKPDPAPAQLAAPVITTTPEEAKVLKDVVANTPEIDIHNPDSVKAALDKKPEPIGEAKDATATRTESIGMKSEPSTHFIRMAVALLGILGFFIGGVLLVKRYSTKLGKLPFGKKERLIQVVATHYLGSKKSISLVKVTGEYMVVGVSNEGISLISKLGPEVSVDKYLEDRFWGGTFEKHLGTYAKDAAVTKEVDLTTYDGAKDLAQPALKTDTIVDKIELSPVRASIKEKLTKLKPLA